MIWPVNEVQQPPLLVGAANPKKITAVKDTAILMAIFAHPDDELLTGALLAHYAAKGVYVYLVVATNGSKGVEKHAHIPAGPALVDERKKETVCSALVLGIQPPIFLGASDQLESGPGGLSSQLELVRKGVDSLINRLRPDAIITFGPSGWTGHPDHRMVGMVVTEAFAAHAWPKDPGLFYSELATGSITDSSWAHYQTVDSSYLTLRIPLDSVDYSKVRTAFRCHASQYRPMIQERLPRFIEQAQRRVAMLRPFEPQSQSKLIFP